MKLVRESLNGSKKPEESAGLVVVCGSKILLVHPTDSRWKGTFSIPKGMLKEGEVPLEAAIRETQEETGLVVEPNQVSDDFTLIKYTDSKGVVYKRVHCFVVYLDEPPALDKEKLQKEEVDWMGFCNKEKAELVLFWRFKELLDYLR